MIDLEIPGYQINAKRAEHRLGTVYDALNVAQARDVELLILHPSLAQFPGFEQRFLDATRDAMSLRGALRGIVAPLDAGSQAGTLYLARSAGQGDGLDAYVAGLQNREAYMPLDTLRKALLAIALRLGALHERGLIHGNLTAASLVATRDAGLLLTDLGLPNLSARHVTRLPQAASQILPYMSPEQTLDQAVGEITDIFAFGVVAYYLATRRMPRPASLWKQGLKVFWAHTPDLAHDLRPDIEPRLSATIHKALSIRPQHRFANATELVHALQDVILDSSTATAVTAPPAPEPAAPSPGDAPAKPPDAATLVVRMEPQSIRQGQSVSVTVRNNGDEPLKLTVRGADPADSLCFDGELEDVDLDPGEIKTVALRVTARQQPLVGRVQNQPFYLSIIGQDGLSEKLEGDVTIAPVAPAWLTAGLLIGLLTLCVAGSVWLWPQFTAAIATVTGETPVAVVAATASATTAAATDMTATPVAAIEDATTAAASATATPTASATTTPTASATAPATATATATEQDTTPTPTARATPDQPAVATEEFAVQVQLGDRNEIWLLTTGNSEPQLLVASAGQPAWSPDGGRLAFTRPENAGELRSELLFVTTASGMGIRSITDDGMQIGGLTWSPDGSQIAFHAAPADAGGNSEYQIFIAQSDGSGVRQLSADTDGFGNMWPLWSPVSMELLAYGVPQSGTSGAQLRLYNAQNQNMNVLYTEDDRQLAAGDYDWSPDGEQVVYSVSSEAGDSQLFVRDANAPTADAIISGFVAVRWPTWSPDGRRISFVASDGDDQEAVFIAGAGGDVEQTMAGAPAIEDLVWSPRGDWLGVAADFEGDGVVQLRLFEISSAESVTLLGDLSDLPSAQVNGPAPVFVTAAWRPRAP